MNDGTRTSRPARHCFSWIPSGQVAREPVAPHPDTPLILDESLQWARQVGLTADDLSARRLKSLNHGSWAGRVYADADREVVRWGADLRAALYFLPSELAVPREQSEISDLIAEWTSASSTGVPGKRVHPLQRSFSDLRERGVARAGERWGRRFSASLDAFCWAGLRGRSFQHQAVDLELTAFRELRSLNLGCEPLIAGVELMTSAVPESEFEDELFLSLRKRAALLCAWVTDLHRYDPTSSRPTSIDPLNLVSALARQYSLTSADALRIAFEVFDTEHSLFVEEFEMLQQTQRSPEVLRFAEGLATWVDGNTELGGLAQG